MSKVDLKIETDDVTINGGYGGKLTVNIENVKVNDILYHLSPADVLTYWDEEDILAVMDKEKVLKYYNLEPEA